MSEFQPNSIQVLTSAKDAGGAWQALVQIGEMAISHKRQYGEWPGMLVHEGTVAMLREDALYKFMADATDSQKAEFYRKEAASE